MKLRQLFEEPRTAVMAFGRMNPPTIGHAKLVDKVKSLPGDPYIFLSQSQKPKTDPLAFADKLRYAKFFFPSVSIGHPEVKTIMQALAKISELGYDNLIYVAGSDRVASFEELINKYNGQPDKDGNVAYNFKSVKVVSAGERDPDADGAEGMSASKMRAAAAAGDLESFKQGVPRPEVADEMYAAVRQGMGIRDEVPAESVREARKIDTSNYKLVKKSDKVELYINKTDPSNAIAILDDGAWDGTMMDGNDGWEFEKRRTSGMHGYFHVDDLKDLFDPNFDESVNEGDVVLDRTSLRKYIRDMIRDYLDQEDDIEKLAGILKMLVGKEVKHRGSRFTISSEDISEACSMKRKRKSRG